MVIDIQVYNVLEKKILSDWPWFGHWGSLNSYGLWWVKNCFIIADHAHSACTCSTGMCSLTTLMCVIIYLYVFSLSTCGHDCMADYATVYRPLTRACSQPIGLLFTPPDRWLQHGSSCVSDSHPPPSPCLNGYPFINMLFRHDFIDIVNSAQSPMNLCSTNLFQV